MITLLLYVFVLCRRSGQKLEPRPSTFWAFDALSPSDIVTSPWMPAAGLLCCRVCVLLYFVAAFVVEATSSEGLAGSGPDWWWITYFTNWGLMLLGLQGLVGSVMTAVYVRGAPEVQTPLTLPSSCSNRMRRSSCATHGVEAVIC